MPIVFAGDVLPLRPFLNPPFPLGAKIVANLETAISNTVATGSKSHSLVLGTEAVDAIAQSGFAALSVANNHVCDAGEASFRESLKLLAQSCQTQFYGVRQNPFATLQEGECRCAIIGCLERCRSCLGSVFPERDVAALIADLAGEFDRIVVTPHWGKEGEFASHPSPRQRRLARRWIEAGAHAVLGHHSHSFHGREWLNGRPVYYSLGNLAFDHVEGRQHALASFGLAVGWSPTKESGVEAWEEFFVFQRDSKCRMVAPESRTALRGYLDAISDDLTNGAWGLYDWARSVGPIYIPKSDASWRRRLMSHPRWSTRVLHWVWSILPSTVLLRWGNRHPNLHVRQRAEALSATLRSEFDGLP